ncbi:Iron dependent repressor, DtxR family [Desulfonema limicola]|uniref:Transcriptional regulator MntR n=1 Tax=Desulfonema limicola TaxID=45656 RepID=A0A975B9F6_9BACT|nr:metal-dependent transcriptional regulator [Desulfonema limicola]QTA81235.1 Iron dependent repressor, DtxR family [Desulfonema limicola]
MTEKEIMLSDSLEDYLETILALETTNKVARVKDIADKMGVLRGSVTGALKNLGEKGLINYKPYSFITLTREGRVIASEVTRRHEEIKNFLQNVLQINEESADANACRMEHAMDRAAIDRLVEFIEYIHHCPRTGRDWIDAFVNFYSTNKHDKTKCSKCMQQCYDRYFDADKKA